MIAKNIKSRLQAAPLTSGVYLMRNRTGEVIYVGKAVSLRKRLQSYFRENSGRPASKTDFLVSEIEQFGWVSTSSEAEALLLEASLIKKFHPKYNVELRDDKSYPYIEMTAAEFPRIRIVRPREQNPRSTYFGPYVDSRLIREALTILRRIFPFCVCDSFPKKPCLDFHIGLCEGPCVAKIARKDYRRNVHNIRLILEGKKDQLLKELQKEMEEFSRNKDFEAAAKVRDQLRALGALFSGTRDVNYYKEAEQLQRSLGLSKRPERIEAFDVSNIMGKQSVGSMVSFFNGGPDKQNYRRFRIKGVSGIDDVQMMAELVRRRYRRLKAEQVLFPDLIVLDGGKGQLSSACEELAKLEVNIPIIALAKREEEIYLPRKKAPIILSKDSLGLRLLQRIRDEAHRFALAYHRKLRTKNTFKSAPASQGPETR